jgi:hypothetical protein
MNSIHESRFTFLCIPFVIAMVYSIQPVSVPRKAQIKSILAPYGIVLAI